MKRTSIFIVLCIVLATKLMAQTGGKPKVGNKTNKPSIMLTPPILRINYAQPSDAVTHHIGQTADGKILTTTTPPQNINTQKNVPNRNVYTNVTMDATKGYILLTPNGMQSKAIQDSLAAAYAKAIENEAYFQKELGHNKTISNSNNQTNAKSFGNLIQPNNAPQTPEKGIEVVDTLGTISDEVPSLLTPIIKPVNKPQAPRPNTESIDPTLLANATKKVASTTTTANGFVMPALETIDPNFVNPLKNKATNFSTSVMPELAAIDGAKTSSNTTVMPELAAIENGKTSNYKTTVMPELAPIEGATNAGTGYSNKMPELAPIEGVVPGKSNQNKDLGMPALAPIYKEDNQSNTSSNYNSNNPRGMVMPAGTILAAQKKVAYIFQPAVPQPANQNKEVTVNYKPGAGGGFIMPELDKIEVNTTASTSSAMPALAPIEKMATEQKEMMPKLALIEEQNVSTVYYNQPRLTQNQPIANTATKPCPCLTPKKKKWYPPKKKYYYKPPAQPVVKYVEQPSQTIVYVPVQQQQQTNPPTPPVKQVIYQEPVQQQAPKDNFTYRDYTNTYKKEQNYKNPCNCGNQQPQQTKPTIFTKSEDPSAYYDPSKYSGVSAGPTSGDYPVNPTNAGADVGMRYTFFVNRKGEYSVKVFNNLMDVLIRQDGKVIEYKVNSPQDANNTPKTNYFGSIDNIAGVPITYNYNRSVNRIGNIDFTYDFEGFIKTIGGTQVLYNNRSRLSQVGNVHVTYNGGSVTSVTPNSGMVVFTND